MKSKREIGESLELLILSYLQELGDKQARLSRNSGASNDIGDVVSSDFYFEAKVRDKDNVILPKIRMLASSLRFVVFNSIIILLVIRSNLSYTNLAGDW